MAVRRIKILPEGTRVVFAEATKAEMLVKEGRAEYVDSPAKKTSKSKAKQGDK